MVVSAAQAATDADSARLVLLSPDGRTTEVAAGSGRPGLGRGKVRSVNEGVSGWVLEHCRSVLVRSVSGGRCYPRSAMRAAAHLRGTDSLAAVPIRDPLDGSCLGALGALAREPDRFGSGSIRTLNLLAGVAGAAITATARERELYNSLADRRIQEERADLLSSMVERVREGLSLVDGQGIILYANAAFGGLFSVEASHLFGRSVDSVIAAATGTPSVSADELCWENDQMELITKVASDLSPRVISLARNSFEYGASPSPGWILTARDATERARWIARLRHQSEHDDLTGLPNRHQLQRRLTELTEEGRGQGTVGVYFIDLDGTKTVNDALGHQAGDELLQVIATRLRARVRPSDLVARYGGDELIALVEPISEAEAPSFAERLLETFVDPVVLDGQSVRLSASIGFALCRPGSNPASLLREADSAMYAAKRAGGNGWRSYQSDLHDAALADLRLSGELQAALDDPAANGLYLAYQPIVHLVTGRCTGVEALLRWDNPRLGAVPPPKVVEVARRFHELDRLSDWVLAQALSDLREWMRAGMQELKLGVNFVPEQLTDPRFAERTLSALEEAGVPCDRLVIEITEYDLLPEMQPKVAAALQLLAGRGVLSALDDVGAGQSNLARLVDLPVQILKVDRLFVMGLPQDRRSSAVVRAFLSVGRDLALEVVAEGVETEAQEAALRAYGCDKVQGYRYSKPLRADAMTAWLRLPPQVVPAAGPGAGWVVRARPHLISADRRTA